MMPRVWSCTEVGGHATIEDAFAVRSHPDEPECLLCAIADGQGGRSGSRLAANLACENCMDRAARIAPETLLRPAAWTPILQAADRMISRHPAAGLTTLAVFCISGDVICGASAGDSAVVLMNGDEDGRILTGRQHKNPPVGSGFSISTGFRSTLVSPWTVLAMTDGVWKFAGWDAILNVAPEQDGQAVIDTLRDRARLPRTGCFQDDFTLVVLQTDVNLIESRARRR
jgi:hypothetical protein